jgi:hypothetical protein
MWLEEMPVAGGLGIWMIWSIVTLRADVRALRRRLAQMEVESTSRAHKESMAA